MKKILLLGSGELGKEFVLAAKRKGVYVIACDKYDNAPAMQVADERGLMAIRFLARSRKSFLMLSRLAIT